MKIISLLTTFFPESSHSIEENCRESSDQNDEYNEDYLELVDLQIEMLYSER